MAVEAAHLKQLKQLVKHLDYYDSDLHVNSALIGSDFLATTIRAWPQFFFAYVLPFPLLQAASFAIAGVLWTKRARNVRSMNALTDEFILSFLASRDEAIEERLSNAEKAKLRAIEQEINEFKKQRRDELSAYLLIDGNKQKIIDALQKAAPPEDLNDQDKWSKRWTYGFNIAFQYATAHWVIWMAITLLFYSKERWKFENWDGVNHDYHADVGNDPGNIPGVLESDDFALLQFILPALIVIGAQAYKLYYKKEQNEQEHFAKQQQWVRAEYLIDQKKEEQRGRAQPAADAPLMANGFFNTERWATILTMSTAFWSAFLVGNLMAWPITGILNRILAEQKHDEHYQMDDEIKILSSFSIIMLGCFAHMYYKYVDMQKELRDAGKNGVTAQTIYNPKETFWDYYSKNPRTAVNIVLDRMSGSGGILAMRFVFMGGIGGYAWDKNDSDGMDHIKEVMPIALTAMVLMIVLNLYQTYYAAQRENVLKDNQDHELVQTKKYGVTF